MGIARLRCRRGCACEPQLIDAHRGSEEALRTVSAYKSQSVPLALDARGGCVLELFVLNRTRSEGYKFKVSELALAARADNGSAAANAGVPPACRR